MTEAASERERAALTAFQHALRRSQTWRHAVRDALAASDAAVGGYSWRCSVCGAQWPSLATDSEFLRRAEQ